MGRDGIRAKQRTALKDCTAAAAALATAPRGETKGERARERVSRHDPVEEDDEGGDPPARAPRPPPRPPPWVGEEEEEEEEEDESS